MKTISNILRSAANKLDANDADVVLARSYLFTSMRTEDLGNPEALLKAFGFIKGV